MSNEDLIYDLLEANPDMSKEDIENIFVVVEMAEESGELDDYDLENIKFYQSIIDAQNEYNIHIVTLGKLLKFKEEELLYL